MDNWYMRTFGRSVKGFTGLVLVFLLCVGCAAKGPQAPVRAGAAEKGSKSSSASGVVKRTDRILKVQVKDQPDRTVIRLTGNAPFQDYQFQRVGEDQFSLNLGDVKNVAGMPALPGDSTRARLSFGGAKPSGGIQLLGALKTPFDYYAINTGGSDLVLTLFFAESKASAPPPTGEYVPAGKSASSVDEAPPPPAPVLSKKKTATSAAVSTPAAKSKDSELGMPVSRQQQADAGLLLKKYTEKPISLDLLDADLRNVLRLLADVTGTNMVIEPDVTGKVTLKVEQVPWDQVLDMVLTMNNLGKERVGNVIRIAKQSKLKDELTQRKDEIKAKQEFLEVTKDLGEIETVYLTVNYAQPSDVANKIKEVKSDKGKVSIDDRTSLIIYSDYPARIEGARQLLKKLDMATAQVMIEARILTTTATGARNLGVQWGDPGTTGGLSVSGGVAGSDAFSQGFQVNHPLAGDVFKMTLNQMIGKTLVNLDARIFALETSGQGKIVATPRVLTLNHVKALITQGTQIPYRKLNEQGVTSTEFKDAVVSLQVTPHITPDRKVRLEINAKQDDANFAVTGADGQPTIDTRSINTELLVEDGGLVTIGGVMKTTDNTSRDGTPGLSRIPIVGRLFKSDSSSTDQRELIIYISPFIKD